MIGFQRRGLGGRLALVSRLGVLTASLALVAAMAATGSFAQGVPQSDDEKAFYSIGTSLAQQLEMVQPISDHELDLLLQGIRDSVAGSTLAVDPNEGSTYVKNLLEARQAKAIEIEKAGSAAFLAKEAKREGAQTTESGLIYTELKAGNGASPAATDKVKVHYHGTLRDGSVFDSSVDRGTPAEFPLNRVIACWTEGVAMMKTGGKSILVCPADIAYGDRRANGRIPPGAALMFEVELIEIVE
jgi:FKBP-type peptidyl-prolyl cis-trans isomerase